MKRGDITRYQNIAQEKFLEFGIPVNNVSHIEIADFGLDEFEKTGLILIVKVNNDYYCSKWLLLMPGQRCPNHFHKDKTETFFILRGTVKIELDNSIIYLKPGEQITLEPNSYHAFSSDEWALIEEVSTHDEDVDSYFENPEIIRTPKVED